ncbi:hypothetical protein [Streptomyces deserti]
MRMGKSGISGWLVRVARRQLCAGMLSAFLASCPSYDDSLLFVLPLLPGRIRRRAVKGVVTMCVMAVTVVQETGGGRVGVGSDPSF